MKNLMKLTAVATLMSTAAFAEVGTDWVASDIDLGTVVAGATPGSAFDTAAADLEFFLGGAEFTTYGAPTIINGMITLPSTTETVYSNTSIAAEIENVKDALEADVYGDSDGIELDGSDSGILGVVANNVITMLGTVQMETNTLKADYIAGNNVGTAELSALTTAVDNLIDAKDDFNNGVAAFDVILGDLTAMSDYNS